MLPCGARQTLSRCGPWPKAGATLILVTSASSWPGNGNGSWSRTENEIGEFSGERKSKPVLHLDIPDDHPCTKGSTPSGTFGDWGLIIYDEVLLPAPVFRMTADLQSNGGWADRHVDP